MLSGLLDNLNKTILPLYPLPLLAHSLCPLQAVVLTFSLIFVTTGQNLKKKKKGKKSKFYLFIVILPS